MEYGTCAFICMRLPPALNAPKSSEPKMMPPGEFMPMSATAMPSNP